MSREHIQRETTQVYRCKAHTAILSIVLGQNIYIDSMSRWT